MGLTPAFSTPAVCSRIFHSRIFSRPIETRYVCSVFRNRARSELDKIGLNANTLVLINLLVEFSFYYFFYVATDFFTVNKALCVLLLTVQQ